MTTVPPPVMNALASLAGELWVTKDRLRVVEAVLAERGLDISAAVDNYQPDVELTAEMDAERQRFIAEIMQHLAASADSES